MRLNRCGLAPAALACGLMGWAEAGGLRASFDGDSPHSSRGALWAHIEEGFDQPFAARGRRLAEPLAGSLAAGEVQPSADLPLRRRFSAYEEDDWVHSLAVSPEGKRLFTGHSFFVAIMWDIESGKEIRRFQGHPNSVRSVALSPDGRRLFSGSDEVAIMWDVETGVEIRRFPWPGTSIGRLTLSPDGRYLFAGGLTYDDDARFVVRVLMWDVLTGQEVRSFEGSLGIITGLAVSRDGRRLFAGSDHGLHAWDVETGQEIGRIGDAGIINAVALSPDGQFLFFASAGDSSIHMWDLKTSQEVRDFPAVGIASLALRPDGQVLFGVGSKNSIRAWEAATGRQLVNFGGSNELMTSAAVSPDGAALFTGSSDGSAYMWNLGFGDGQAAVP